MLSSFCSWTQQGNTVQVWEDSNSDWHPPSAKAGAELFVDDQLYTERFIDLCLFCVSPFKY